MLLDKKKYLHCFNWISSISYRTACNIQILWRLVSMNQYMWHLLVILLIVLTRWFSYLQFKRNSVLMPKRNSSNFIMEIESSWSSLYNSAFKSNYYWMFFFTERKKSGSIQVLLMFMIQKEGRTLSVVFKQNHRNYLISKYTLWRLLLWW